MESPFGERLHYWERNGTFIHPREVFRPAIRHAAVAVVVVHNHPSGDLTPSQADLSLTERLRLAGELLGIPLPNHVVIGESGGFLSIRDVRPWETPAQEMAITRI
ncbi:MAG: JAB domain-containing protein [Halobacteria archaeon]